jgi:hypothetical protein
VELTTHLNLVPRFGMSEAVPPSYVIAGVVLKAHGIFNESGRSVELTCN